ncbi:MAG: 23S rRNA (adenine(2503)-C(2))-methyltransferase RlmN, partial [Propionibacteriaceae bacterium]|nr:23S rRNA (adenine(2503)-C(2))-methyltransferase RlmN [Propionibacteriaceae bacterium]
MSDRPAKPPRHWAELTAPERTDALQALGLPAYRADQLSRHYFERYEADPTTWSDLPAASREGVTALFPPLAVPVAERSADGGTTVKAAYRLTGGALVETVLMTYP